MEFKTIATGTTEGKMAELEQAYSDGWEIVDTFHMFGPGNDIRPNHTYWLLGRKTKVDSEKALEEANAMRPQFGSR